MLNLRSLWLSFVLAVELVAGAFGASPVARIGSNIDEQSIIEPGDPLEFEADSLTEKERCKWKVIPAFSQTGKPTYKLSGDKRVLTVFSRSGTYAITLYVWNDEDMAETVKTITVGKPTIIVGPLPPKPEPIPPKPEPTPEPIPQPLGLVAAVANSVRLHVPASERAIAERLAASYKAGALMIKNNQWPADLRSVSLKQRELNDGVQGFKREVWIDVLRDVATVLGEAHNAGKLNDAKQLEAAWKELGDAFAEVAKAAK